jgi:hypothetical protein
MPKKQIDYSKTIIYKIVCNDLNITDCYVGHTTNFIKRKSSHKFYAENETKSNLKVYVMIRSNGGWDNWTMIEVEKYCCNDANEARKKEREWLEKLSANLNIMIPSRSHVEWVEDNKEVIKEKQQRYHKENKEKLSEQKKQYRIVNKEQLQEHSKKYYKDNNETIKLEVKEYRDLNKDKIKNLKQIRDEKKLEEQPSYNIEKRENKKIYNKLWYDLNKENIQKKQKQYYENNKEHIKQTSRLYRTAKTSEDT